jgi:hypothetical protein
MSLRMGFAIVIAITTIINVIVKWHCHTLTGNHNCNCVHHICECHHRRLFTMIFDLEGSDYHHHKYSCAVIGDTLQGHNKRLVHTLQENSPNDPRISPHTGLWAGSAYVHG